MSAMKRAATCGASPGDVDSSSCTSALPITTASATSLTARAVAEVADAVVIGSELVQRLEKAAPGEAATVAGQFIAEIRAALDA